LRRHPQSLVRLGCAATANVPPHRCNRCSFWINAEPATKNAPHDEYKEKRDNANDGSAYQQNDQDPFH
jgi:hypothetical protein